MDHSITCRVITIAGVDQKQVPRRLAALDRDPGAFVLGAALGHLGRSGSDESRRARCRSCGGNRERCSNRSGSDALIEEPTTTFLLLPGQAARVDGYGNYIVEIGG